MLPAGVRDTLLRWHGPAGALWIASLPTTVERLCAEWKISLGEPFGGGTHSLVAPVLGSPEVIKIPFVDEENSHESFALRCYGGEGAVRLLLHDEQSNAMLLERVQPGAPCSDHHGVKSGLMLLCDVLRRLQCPVDNPPERLPRVKALLDRWTQAYAEARDDLDESLRLAAQVACLRLHEPDGPELLVNRDGHRANLLSAEREPWLLIDPKPLLGESAFDGGFPVVHGLTDMSELHEPDLDWEDGVSCASELVSLVAGRLGAPAERVRAWSLLRAVEDVTWSGNLKPEHSRRLAGWLAASV